MRPGHFEKVDRYVNGIKDGSKWCVACVACMGADHSAIFFKGEALKSKIIFHDRLIRQGWFVNANKKMQCGSHGTKENNSALNPTIEWRENPR